jgi:hypothetical protein
MVQILDEPVEKRVQRCQFLLRESRDYGSADLDGNGSALLRETRTSVGQVQATSPAIVGIIFCTNQFPLA